jgi:hypothetical protein
MGTKVVARELVEKKASVPNSARNIGLLEIDCHCWKSVP